MNTTLRHRTGQTGSVAVEFAMVGSAFIGLMMLVFQLGFLLYAQVALDYAVKEAARQMQTGQQQQTITNPAAQKSFQSLVFCPLLSPFLPCTGVVVTLQPVNSFQMATNPPPDASASINPGGSGSLMLMQAYYTPNIPTWPLNVTLLIGTAAYLNEF